MADNTQSLKQIQKKKQYRRKKKDEKRLAIKVSICRELINRQGVRGVSMLDHEDVSCRDWQICLMDLKRCGLVRERDRVNVCTPYGNVQHENVELYEAMREDILHALGDARVHTLYFIESSEPISNREFYYEYKRACREAEAMCNPAFNTTPVNAYDAFELVGMRKMREHKQGEYCRIRSICINDAQVEGFYVWWEGKEGNKDVPDVLGSQIVWEWDFEAREERETDPEEVDSRLYSVMGKDIKDMDEDYKKSYLAGQAWLSFSFLKEQPVLDHEVFYTHHYKGYDLYVTVKAGRIISILCIRDRMRYYMDGGWCNVVAVKKSLCKKEPSNGQQWHFYVLNQCVRVMKHVEGIKVHFIIEGRKNPYKNGNPEVGQYKRELNFMVEGIGGAMDGLGYMKCIKKEVDCVLDKYICKFEGE